MAKQRPKLKPETPAASAVSRSGQNVAVGWTFPTRSLASLAILWHVTAVFVAPWANQTSPRSLMPDFAVRDASGNLRPDEPPRDEDFVEPPLLGLLSRIFRPYLNATYSNHGYDFFTPDPGGSYLIGFDAYDANNQVIAKGEYPERTQQWPRLFYHRHMMLTAQVEEFGLEWPNYIGRRLLRLHDAQRVHLFFVYHRLPLPEEVAAGADLVASRFYETVREFDVYAGQDEFRAVPRPADSAVRIPGVAP